MVYSTLDSVAARIECPIVESRQCRESANGALKALLGLGFFTRHKQCRENSWLAVKNL